MAYDSTQVPVDRTQAKIRALLMAHGAIGIAFVSQPPTEGFTTSLAIEGRPYSIRIQADCREARDASQELRRLWRVLFYHLKAMFEAADSGVMELREMILPYIVTKNGMTVGEHILPQLDNAVAGNPLRMLPARSAVAE